MALGTEYRTIIVFAPVGFGSQCVIVRNWKVTAGSTADDPLNLAKAIEATTAPLLQPCLPSNIQINSVRVTLSSTPDINIVTRFIGLFGTHSADRSLPPQLATLIRLVWNPLSSRHPGKVFVPYIPIVQTAPDVAAYLADVQTLATSLLSVSFPAGGGGTDYEGRVWHRSTADSSPILTASVDSHYWTQRDRASNTGMFAIDQYPMVP